MDTKDIQAVRRARLQWLLKHEFNDNQARLAQKAKRAPSQIADMLTGRKSFGEKVARAIEIEIEKPELWLDVISATAKSPIEPAQQTPENDHLALTVMESKMLQHLRQLDGQVQANIADLIESIALSSVPASAIEEANQVMRVARRTAANNTNKESGIAVESRTKSVGTHAVRHRTRKD